MVPTRVLIRPTTKKLKFNTVSNPTTNKKIKDTPIKNKFKKLKKLSQIILR